MNSVFLMGRLTKDPAVYTTESGKKIAKYYLAVDKRTKDGGADFIPCVAFGKAAEFVDKYLAKGVKVVVGGSIATGSYTDSKTGNKVFAISVAVNSHEFAESKANNPQKQSVPQVDQTADAYMDIPDGFSEEVPFT